MSSRPISFRLNGKPVTAQVPPAQPLLQTLREALGITSAKEGCGKGECGACTVLLDGRPVASCLVLTGQVEDAEITTVEGLGSPESPDPVQRALVELGAVQCGYCTPGLVLSARGLLLENPHPTREEIREAIAGNVCRCTGYQRIVWAIERAAGAAEGRAERAAESEEA